LLRKWSRSLSLPKPHSLQMVHEAVSLVIPQNGIQVLFQAMYCSFCLLLQVVIGEHRLLKRETLKKKHDKMIRLSGNKYLER
jgi:hypothetical protein